MSKINKFDKNIIYRILNEYKKQFNNNNLFISDIILSDNEEYWAEFLSDDLYNQNYNLYINSKLIHKNKKFIKIILYHEFTHLADALEFSDCKNITVFKYIMATYSEYHASEIEMMIRLKDLETPINLNSKINKDETIKSYMDQCLLKVKKDLNNMMLSNISINTKQLYYFCGYLKAINNYNINYDYDKMSFPKELIIPCNNIINTLVYNDYLNVKDAIDDYIHLRDKILEISRNYNQKINVKKHSKILKIIRKIFKIDLIAVIIGLATLVVTRYVDLFRKPYITMSDDIPISFIINNEYSGYYDLNYQQMLDEINFQDQMVTLVNICNSLSNNIQLNKIYIDISNIKQDINPYFNIFSETRDDGVYLNISNCGWGDVSNVNFTFVSSNDDIINYINKNTIDIYIEEINIGETIEFPFILNKDIIDTDIYSTIDFSAYCIIDGVNVTNSIKNTLLSYEIYNGTITVPGMGGTSVLTC